MSIFKSNRKIVYFLFFLLFFLLAGTAKAEILYSQDKTDSFFSSTDLPDYFGTHPIIGEYGAFIANTTTTIKSISVFGKFSDELVTQGLCHLLVIEDITDNTSFRFMDGINYTVCQSTTTPGIITFNLNGENYPELPDASYQIKTGHLYSIFMPYFANEASGNFFTWYGTKNATGTLDWAGYCPRSDEECIIGFSTGAISINPEYPFAKFAWAVSDNHNPVWIVEFPTEEIACEDWDFGGLGIGNAICNALVYLFVPDNFYLQKFGDLFDVIKNKPPFGYYYSTKDAIVLLNASSTPAFSFPDMGSIKTDFFDKIRAGLAWIFWVMFAFYIIKRIGDFVP